MSGIISIYLATSHGKACVQRLRPRKPAMMDNDEPSKVQVMPAAGANKTRQLLKKKNKEARRRKV